MAEACRGLWPMTAFLDGHCHKSSIFPRGGTEARMCLVNTCHKKYLY